MAIHKGAPRSLVKRLRVELREKCGVEAPEVLHLWAEANAPQPGMTVRAHVVSGAVERIVVVSVPLGNWEEAYQRILAACIAGQEPADAAPSN
jgi:hypothetical protein